MRDSEAVKSTDNNVWRATFGALALVLVGCGGVVTSGVAVGRVGQQLSTHAQAAPQGAEVCAIQEALTAPPQGNERSVSSTCSKVLRSDQLWRRAMTVLAAHGDTLATISLDKDTPGAGQLEAASTGVRGADWLEVDETEKTARDAVAQLVAQLNANAGKGDVARAVKDAAAPVKTLCTGLAGYLEAQTKSLGEVQKEMEKKRASRTDRRCSVLDNRNVCVSESTIDRVVYAHALGHVAMLENNHVEAYNAVAGFCAAHVKLEEAAAGGRLSKDATHGEIIEAVRSARRLQPAPLPSDSAAPPKK